MPEDLSLQAQAPELAADTNVFNKYLFSLSLPNDNVVASSEERANVQANLSSLINTLPLDQRRQARYLSKFVAATAIGLFDAALNYIWNEVVLHLREKAIAYGLDLFFDAAVGGSNRADYSSEADLPGLKDSVLLNTCLKLEIISKTIHKKLSHILDMRNDVAASHPNVESIGGYELLGWLQTCVKDVLTDTPSQSAIKTKQFIDNIRTQTVTMDNATADRLKDELKNLSTPHIHNLLITLFGIYGSPNSDQTLRSNIAKIAPTIWEYSSEAVRHKIGITLDGYRTNLDTARLNQGEAFIALVDGRNYETPSARSVALDHLADRLNEAHDGRDNFYKEPSIMREILGYVKISADLPISVAEEIIRTVLRCRIGRGIPYQKGVSPAGAKLYDNFLSILDDGQIGISIQALFTPEINNRLTNPICQIHLESTLNLLRGRAISERLKEVIDFLLKDIPNAYRANRDKDFKELCKPMFEI